MFQPELRSLFTFCVNEVREQNYFDLLPLSSQRRLTGSSVLSLKATSVSSHRTCKCQKMFSDTLKGIPVTVCVDLIVLLQVWPGRSAADSLRLGVWESESCCDELAQYLANESSVRLFLHLERRIRSGWLALGVHVRTCEHNKCSAM